MLQRRLNEIWSLVAWLERTGCKHYPVKYVTKNKVISESRIPAKKARFFKTAETLQFERVTVLYVTH